MNISWGDRIKEIKKVEPVNKRTNIAKVKESSSSEQMTDGISISDKARIMKMAKDMIYSEPLVDNEKIAPIKKKIENGEYDIPGSVTINKIEQRLRERYAEIEKYSSND